MTRKSKREIARELDDLDAPEDADDYESVTIRHVAISSDGEELWPVRKLDIWEDEDGWHSERTELSEGDSVV